MTQVLSKKCQTAHLEELDQGHAAEDDDGDANHERRLSPAVFAKCRDPSVTVDRRADRQKEGGR